MLMLSFAVARAELMVRSNSLQGTGMSSDRPFSNVSSVYSQPTPHLPFKHPKLDIPRSSSIYPDDISPPDTPRTIDGGRSKKSSPNVSPITESGSTSHDLPQAPRTYISNLPVPRVPEKYTGSASHISGWRDKVNRGGSPDAAPKTTRWDDFSGEPTDSDTGKPAQAIPGTTPFDTQNAVGVNIQLGNSVHVNGGQQPKTFLVDRLRKVGKRDTNQSPVVREEWKGASGRTTIVRPLVDKPLPPGVAPVFTSAGRKYPDTPKSQAAPKSSPTTPGFTITAQKRSIPPLRISDIDEIIKPIVPLKVGRNSPRSPTTRDPLQLKNTSLMPEDTRSPLARNPSAEHMRDTPQETLTDLSPVHSPEESSPGISENQIRAAMEELNIGNQPASRFSATTYNTTIPDSPPTTPRLSLDTQPPLPTPPSSVLNRKRPVPSSGVSFNKTPNRKPTPSEVTIGEKSLPQSPPEAAAVDRVASLQAKLDTLNRRRTNLSTVIHELTHVVQPSSVAYDMASRQEIKKTVEGLHTESAAVAKEIHETGLKLHRVMKRRDEQSMYEPTGLWVRRVTE